MKPPYTQQRFHPSLKIGYTALIADLKKEVPAHCQQGDMDGACGAVAASVSLALLRVIPDAATISTRRSGVAARLWNAAKAIYFDGIDSRELYELLLSLDANLKLDECSGKHREVLAFAKASAVANLLVILSWRTRNFGEHHWVTVVGVSGKKEAGKFVTEAFLCLDPGAAQPDICGYNARLDLFNPPGRASKSYFDYWVSGDLEPLSVTLTGAISLQISDSS